MGYYANLIHADEAMRVVDADAVLDELDLAQLFHPSGRISWCKPVASYGRGPVALAELLTDFGFRASASSTHLSITGWQNNKIGSSFERVLEALTVGIANTVRWTFHGEDGRVWIETVGPRDRDTTDLAPMKWEVSSNGADPL